MKLINIFYNNQAKMRSIKRNRLPGFLFSRILLINHLRKQTTDKTSSLNKLRRFFWRHFLKLMEYINYSFCTKIINFGIIFTKLFYQYPLYL
jgi:hypothetical protein